MGLEILYHRVEGSSPVIGNFNDLSTESLECQISSERTHIIQFNLQVNHPYFALHLHS